MTPAEITEIESMRREIVRLRALLAGDFAISRLHYEAGKPLEIEARAASLGALAAVCRYFLGDSPNYVELAFEDDLGRLTLTIQRADGETPANKAARLEARVEELGRELARCRGLLPR